MAQWTRNLRLELGHILAFEPVRIIEFAPTPPASSAASAPASGYAPPATATSWKADRFTGADFPLQPDGTLSCPAGHVLVPQEHHREHDGSLRVVYSASIRDCGMCPLREHCQWSERTTGKPRQVSLLLHPLVVGSTPLLWRDWNRRHQRQECIHLHRQRLDIQMVPDAPLTPTVSPPMISRAQRAHYRLSGEERLTRNARTGQAERITLTLFGIPECLVIFLGLVTA